MSSPARSWSLMTTASASWNFSRKRTSIMQVSSGRPHMLTSNQRGRGQRSGDGGGENQIFGRGEHDQNFTMTPARDWRGAPIVRKGVLPVSISLSNAFSIAANNSMRRDRRQAPRASVSDPCPQREMVDGRRRTARRRGGIAAEALHDPARGAEADRAAARRDLRHALAVELAGGECRVVERPRRRHGEQPARAPLELELGTDRLRVGVVALRG